jgi:hypothetical protein
MVNEFRGGILTGATVNEDANKENDGLLIKFYSKPVEHPYNSKIAQRPIFVDVDYVYIEIAGDKNTIIDTPVNDYHRQRFPNTWRRYKERNSETTSAGTPLTQWPLLTPAQAEELRGMKFSTVEQIASAADGALDSVTMIAGMAGHVLRDKARNFLKVASDAGLVEAQDARLKQMEDDRKAADEKHAQEMQELREQIARMAEGKQIEPSANPSVDKRTKRHRRTKAEMEAARQAA